MKVNQTNSKTNPQIKSNQGMEAFLTPSPSLTQNVQKTNPQEVEVPKQTTPKVEPKNKTNSHDQIEEEVQGKIEEIERQLKIKTTLDLTTFNKIAYNKQLLFKILFIRQKIYLHVKDNNGRNAIIAINVPRFGGTSLRYMISQCTIEFCKVVEKKTNKGNILSYSPISMVNNENEDDMEDIFD